MTLNADREEGPSPWGVEMSDLESNPRFRVNLVDGSNSEELKSLCESENDEQNDAMGSYAKSFRHFTREALPRMDNYRNIMSIQAAYRPTLEELRNATLHGKNATIVRMNGAPQSTTENEANKFGWIKGVLIRNLLNIWGVMLFLRLSWVIGQAGMVEGILLILSTTVVTGITSLSMSAISTNGLIKGGGTYFMISRSLGPEFGASIGLIFSLANAMACAMYVVGFCESLLDLLDSYELRIIDGGVQDMRIIGSITILCLLGIVVIGMEWEAKTQMGLLVVLLIAMADFFVGAIMGPQSNETKAKGFVGLNKETFVHNLYPDYRYSEGVNQTFFSVFSVFFPAASGFCAGANISGDLKDPQKALPKGTILAIALTTLSYVVMAIVAGSTVERDASGIVEEFLNGTFTNCTHRKCSYGLQNSFQVMELVSAFGLIIYAGCFAATLSSALASLVSAPKVFQALCKDKLYPYISFFGKGYGKTGEPVRGYILTFFIAIAFILVGELNAIAPLISNFFLAAYALINYSTFHASLVKPIGWRPTFKYYSKWLSLLGAILCCVVMFLISWWTALITLSAVLALYLIVTYRKPDVNWGSSTQAQSYSNALATAQQLNRTEDHVKNYRPQILILSGLPSSRPPLIDFAQLITKNDSLLVCGHIVKALLSHKVRHTFAQKARSWLECHKIKAFYSPVDDATFEEGARTLMQASGLGKLKPNILLMGYKADWQTCNPQQLTMYFDVIHKAMDLHMAVAILRVKEGLDYSKIISDEVNFHEVPNDEPTQTLEKKKSLESLQRVNSLSQMSQESSASELTPPETPYVTKSRVKEKWNVETTMLSEKVRESKADIYRGVGGTRLTKEVLNNLTQFQKKQKKGNIDVWWLYDDGGLTLLLPYIISTRRNWIDCKLRVFTIANKQDELQFEQRNMASLLAKFRIDYSDLKVIPDITKKPLDSTVTFFNNLIESLKTSSVKEDGVSINEADLLAMKDKTNRHLRLRELLLEYSSSANLVVMTLPMPRKNMMTAGLYMAWLETLSRDMPPFLLLRGNQQSVLTFYS